MQQDYRQTRVEADMPLDIARVRVVHNLWEEPIDIVGRSHHHHVELTLLPNSSNARGCFCDHWDSRRFEPMGDLFLLPADHRVRARSDCRQQNSIMCDFRPEAVENWLEQNLEWTDSRLQGALDIANPGIRGLLMAMGQESRNPGLGSDTMVELMAGQLAIELSRHLLRIEEQGVDGGLAPRRLRLIDQRLAEDPAPPSLGELAALCGLSIRHLTRAFRVTRQESLGRYIARFRLEHARRLLASGMSVKAVAYTTGFSEPSNFTAAFRRDTGETPRQYQLRMETPAGSTRHTGRRIH